MMSYIKQLEMFFDQNSSINEESENFVGLSKKINNYNIKIQDSDDNSSGQFSPNKQKRKNYSKRISELLNIEESDVNKTKRIKKNCVSAKLSRERKKQYIQLLEKKAEDLRTEVVNRKKIIEQNKNSIIQILKQSNPEKFDYIQEHLKDSRALVSEIQKTQALANKKDDEQAYHQEKLSLMINSYMYKFGFNGVLRKDVLEILKKRWYELVINEKVLLSGKEEQLKIILQKFEKCLRNLAKKQEKLDRLFRKYQKDIPLTQVGKLILKKQFFEPEEPLLSKKEDIRFYDFEDSE